jgi:hypothetical protein
MLTRREFKRIVLAGSVGYLFVPRRSSLLAAEAGPPVATTAGKGRGVLDEGVHTFKGIPYGRADQWQ